jgi:hypothetical protein
MKLIDRLRPHRATLAIVAIGIAGFGLLAIEDRAVRHGAGISDDCAWFQMINQQFPMTRCYSLDEFLEFVNRRPQPDGRREDQNDNGDTQARICEAITRESPEPERRSGANYIYSLLSRCEPDEPRDAGDKQ